MKKLILVVLCACACASEATQYSCLSIITAAKQAGKWEALKAWISAAGLKDEWDKCSYLSDAYPQYAQITNALVTAGIVTDDEIRTILANSIDTAIPDDSLRRIYDFDMSNATGRVKWHGKVTRTVFDTNTLTKAQIHEDGYVHTSRFNVSMPSSIDKKISSAERKARIEADRRARLEAAERRRLARISDLQTNMTALATALASGKQYPLELATMLLQHELNTLIGTNTVTVVTTPEK